MSGDDRHVVAVFGSSWVTPDSEGWRQAERCGALIAAAGCAVATGGYGGAMEAVSKGAAEAGGHVIGVTAPPIFPNRAGANRWVSEERPARTLTSRLDALISGTSAVIALPGSIGTLTELMVAWNIAFIDRLGGVDPAPVVAVGAEWATMVARLADDLIADRTMVACVSTVDEAVAHVLVSLADNVTG